MAALATPAGWPAYAHLHGPGCILTFGAVNGAHAHIRGPLRGWVCLEGTTAPPAVLDHELAHLLAGHVGHTRTWQRIFAELRLRHPGDSR